MTYQTDSRSHVVGVFLPRPASKDQVWIQRALESLQSDPFSGDIKRLQPSGWRRRVGNYRILYDLLIDQRLIVITAIARRTSTTY
jgi:mRNA-degrading endonuclease RelE of RelBE toxin-antitoxin system